MKRLFWIFLALAVLFLIPFFLWGGSFEEQFTREGAVEWLRNYGRWAWFPGLLLLMGDLVLPIPGTAVMAALGFLYGPLLGGIFSAMGSILAGLLGYGLCRSLGRPAAETLLGPDELEEGEELFRRNGGWIVAVSRWLPLFPEVIACMAGLARMPLLTFVAALACGSIPLGFTFAVIGFAGEEYPIMAILLSAGLPPIIWYFARNAIRDSSQQPHDETTDQDHE